MSYILDASLLVGSSSRNPLPTHHHKTGVEGGGIAFKRTGKQIQGRNNTLLVYKEYRI